MKEAKTVQEIAELAALIAVAGRAYIYACSRGGLELAQGYGEQQNGGYNNIQLVVEYSGVVDHLKVTVHPEHEYYFNCTAAQDPKVNTFPGCFLILNMTSLRFTP